MGAQDFMSIAQGKTAMEAFSRARDDAAWEHGHGGYTGTIAEKHSFVLARGKPAEMSARDYADRLMSIQPDYDGDNKLYVFTYTGGKAVKGEPVTEPETTDWNVWDEKWGPALCIPTGRSVNDENEYLFCGMASS